MLIWNDCKLVGIPKKLSLCSFLELIVHHRTKVSTANLNVFEICAVSTMTLITKNKEIGGNEDAPSLILWFIWTLAPFFLEVSVVIPQPFIINPWRSTSLLQIIYPSIRWTEPNAWQTSEWNQHLSYLEALLYYNNLRDCFHKVPVWLSYKLLYELKGSPTLRMCSLKREYTLIIYVKNVADKLLKNMLSKVWASMTIYNMSPSLITHDRV